MRTQEEIERFGDMGVELMGDPVPPPPPTPPSPPGPGGPVPPTPPTGPQVPTGWRR
jgi:hypothetical protein